MFRHRFFVSLFITMCFYTLLIAAFFYTQYLHVGTEQKSQEKIITMSLASYEPEVVPPSEELVVEEPPKKELVPEPIEEVEPEPEEPVVEEKVPEPVVEKIVPKPKPIVKKIVKTKKRVKKKVVKRKVRTKKRSQKKKVSSAKKNAFLSAIRHKINKSKTYPRIAQRRGMQGSVKVRFTILRNGRVSDIKVTGKKVFHTSAKSAVKKAFPINTKNAPLSLPERVNLTLRYQIR